MYKHFFKRFLDFWISLDSIDFNFPDIAGDNHLAALCKQGGRGH